MSGPCHEGVVGSGASRAQGAALELFQVAALMLGDEEQAVSLVERAFAEVQADPCADAGAAGEQARPRLIATALTRLASQHPEAFAAPPQVMEDSTCIDTDDLSAAGISGDHLAALLNGPGTEPGPGMMREWVESLTPSFRAIFVLRAVAGQTADEALASLRQSGAPGVAGWRREHISVAYRRALCMLASFLVTANSISEPV